MPWRLPALSRLGADLELPERHVLGDVRLLRQAEDPLADDVALDLVGPAVDRRCRRAEELRRYAAAERRLRAGEHGPRAADVGGRVPPLPRDVRGHQLSERLLRTGAA